MPDIFRPTIQGYSLTWDSAPPTTRLREFLVPHSATSPITSTLALSILLRLHSSSTRTSSVEGDAVEVEVVVMVVVVVLEVVVWVEGVPVEEDADAFPE